jgi:threonine dehydrogenase-like Zn-dependent dehydrogenase
MELARSAEVDLGALVSERFALSEVVRAFEALNTQRGLKVVVEPRAD